MQLLRKYNAELEPLNYILPGRGSMQSKKEDPTEHTWPRDKKKPVVVLISTFEYLNSAAPGAIDS